MTWKWGVFLADLNPVIGSEQKGRRPVMIISDEDFNSLMPVVTIIPITSLKPGRRLYPNEALLKNGTGGLDVDSLALVHQIRTVSKERLVARLGMLDEEAVREAITVALKVHLNLP
jgi:mRNA interferase MazF